MVNDTEKSHIPARIVYFLNYSYTFLAFKVAFKQNRDVYLRNVALFVLLTLHS